jgi:putative ABC transport system ATP-binding protein
MSEHLLLVEDLQKDFHMGEVVVPALRGVDLVTRPGEFLAIMGPSGSGKSTLLHLLAGLELPSAGSIQLDQRYFHTLSDRDLTILRRNEIGIVFQFYNLLPSLSAIENVALPLMLVGESRAVSLKRALEALTWVELLDRADHTPDRLSGGEQQRTALARALVFKPRLLLADEPTGNLDRAAGEKVLQLLRRAADDFNQTIVMVTHDPLAATFADRVVFLADGRLVHELRDEGVTASAILAAQSKLQS